MKNSVDEYLISYMDKISCQVWQLREILFSIIFTG